MSELAKEIISDLIKEFGNYVIRDYVYKPHYILTSDDEVILIEKGEINNAYAIEKRKLEGELVQRLDRVFDKILERLRREGKLKEMDLSDISANTLLLDRKDDKYRLVYVDNNLNQIELIPYSTISEFLKLLNVSIEQPVEISMLSRIGSKLRYSSIINEYMPDYDVYVEPFLGGGWVFLLRDKLGKQSHINDLDPDIYHFWKTVIENPYKVKAVILDILKTLTYNKSDDIRENLVNQIIDVKRYNNPNYPSDIVKAGKIFFTTRLNKVVKSNTKISEEYVDELFDKLFRILEKEAVYVYNEDAIRFLYRNKDKFDNERTFIFLDPPYLVDKSDEYYSGFKVNHKDLFDLMKSFKKAKIMMTINAHPLVEETFKDWILVEYEETKRIFNSEGPRGKQLCYLVMNYDVIKDIEQKVFIKDVEQKAEVIDMDVRILEIELSGSVIEPTPGLYEKVYRMASNIFNDEGWNKLWILSGRAPIWLYTALTHIAHPTAGVAIYEPRMNKAIIVSRHRPDIPPEFSIIDIPENAKRVVMRI